MVFPIGSGRASLEGCFQWWFSGMFSARVESKAVSDRAKSIFQKGTFAENMKMPQKLLRDT
jgi:hypothetical protein